MAIQAHMRLENFGFSLGNSHQDFSVMENTNGFNQACLSNQNHQQQQQQQFDQFLYQKNHNLIPVPQSNDFTQNVSALIQKHRMEIDRYVNLQSERLRQALQEQRKRQIAQLLRRYESKAQFLLRQKDHEIAKAINRRIELENYLRNLEIENQTWQKAARDNEAIVASLNSTIERLRETASLSNNVVEDEGSCCDEEIYRGNQEQGMIMDMVCKCCNVRNSCVIMLPCRHMSSCRHCEAFLDSCPVCSVGKESTIEALV